MIYACLLAALSAPASALELPPPGASLCFGFGASPYFADVIDAVPGTELIVMNVGELLLADNDMDDLRALRSSVTVRVLDRSGNIQWSSPLLRLFSKDSAIFLDGGGFVPDSFFFPGIGSDTYAATLFFGGAVCYGSVYAVEASGQKYLAVMIAYLTQSGEDESTAVDESLASVWILNRNTGAIVHQHNLRSKPGRFFAGATISGIGDVDGDSNDELVAAWAQPFGGGTYKMLYETYNVLNGTLEDRFTFFTKNARAFE